MTPEAGAPKSDAANEYYGRLRAFTDLSGSQKSWVHMAVVRRRSTWLAYTLRERRQRTGIGGHGVAGARELLGSS
jgi:hypothetical protein